MGRDFGPTPGEGGFVPVRNYRLLEVEIDGRRRFAAEVEDGPHAGLYLAELSELDQGIDLTRAHEVDPAVLEQYGLRPGVMLMTETM